MEYLIVIGGLISLPIIHYCNQATTQSSESTKPEKESHPKPEPLSESDLKALRQRAEERRARILKDLTPTEQGLLKEYLENLKNPKKDPQSLNLLVAVVLFSLTFLLILGIFIYNDNSQSSKQSEL